MKFIWATILIVILLIASLFIGAVDIPAADVLDIILGKSSSDDALRYTVIGSRLPQALTALLAGAGLAVPHIARLIWHTDNHRILMPGTILTGSAVALLCCIISVLPSGGIAPINAITPIIGVPVILYVILRRRH